MTVDDSELCVCEQCDKTTKLGQNRRCQSWDIAIISYLKVNADYKKERKIWDAWVFSFLRKREVERSETGEFNIGVHEVVSNVT